MLNFKNTIYIHTYYIIYIHTNIHIYIVTHSLNLSFIHIYTYIHTYKYILYICSKSSVFITLIFQKLLTTLPSIWKCQQWYLPLDSFVTSATSSEGTQVWISDLYSTITIPWLEPVTIKSKYRLVINLEQKTWRIESLQVIDLQ